MITERSERSDFGTPIEWEPPCPCGAAIRLKGPVGATCEQGHLAQLSLGPVAYLEWQLPGAWKYVRPLPPEDVWARALEVVDGGTAAPTHRHLRVVK